MSDRTKTDMVQQEEDNAYHLARKELETWDAEDLMDYATAMRANQYMDDYTPEEFDRVWRNVFGMVE